MCNLMSAGRGGGSAAAAAAAANWSALDSADGQAAAAALNGATCVTHVRALAARWFGVIICPAAALCAWPWLAAAAAASRAEPSRAEPGRAAEPLRGARAPEEGTGGSTGAPRVERPQRRQGGAQWAASAAAAAAAAASAREGRSLGRAGGQTQRRAMRRPHRTAPAPAPDKGGAQARNCASACPLTKAVCVRLRERESAAGRPMCGLGRSDRARNAPCVCPHCACVPEPPTRPICRLGAAAAAQVGSAAHPPLRRSQRAARLLAQELAPSGAVGLASRLSAGQCGRLRASERARERARDSVRRPAERTQTPALRTHAHTHT